MSLERVLRDFDECRASHDVFVNKVEKRYKAYRGVLNRKSEAAKWTSKLHPPYVFQIVETIVGNMIDDRTSFQVRARPFVADMEEVEARKAGAKSLEYLLRYEQDLDHFQEKQRPFALQASIAGLTVAKNYWLYQHGPVKRLRPKMDPIPHPETGEPMGFVPSFGPAERVEVLKDDPTMEVVDVRDFYWHEAATSVEKAKYVIHRVWMLYDELQEMAARGIYDQAAVDKLSDSRDFSSEASYREQSLFEADRTKDQIEVLEYWTNDRVITVANRSVLLANKETPFWHREKPFVVCSSMPDLFRIPGVSDVEIVEELQEMLWTVMNQRLDNLMLINNAIILIRSDIDDPDQFEFAPGERWLVDDPKQVEMWTPDPMPATVSLEAEQQIKGDLQNITGGMPFVAGADSSQIDQKTATGVSIVTSLAQRRLQAKKQNFVLAHKRIAEQQVALLQQFMTEERVVQIVGQGGDPSFIRIKPQDIQGRFNVEIEAKADSLMRQEKRAEGQALVQVASQIAPIAQAVGSPLNLRAFIEDWLRDYDVIDVDRYFAPPGSQAAQPPGLASQPTPPGQASQPGQPAPQGMTAPQATAAQVSPSNPSTMAPSTFMQRALAMTGGGRNA